MEDSKKLEGFEVAAVYLEAEARKIPLGEGNVSKGFSSTYNALMFGAKTLRDACEELRCPSTYTHSNRGKLGCEKDKAHLHRIGDVEHKNGRTVWMSI